MGTEVPRLGIPVVMDPDTVTGEDNLAKGQFSLALD